MDTPSTTNPRQPTLSLQKHPGSAKHVWMIWLVVVCVAAAIAFLVVRALRSQAASTSNARNSAGQAVPVVVAQATVGDLANYLPEGLLGTVTPLRTITVTAEASGQVIKINFQEGQIVHEGDVLLLIDPSPYEAALLSAQGALGRDQALLANAKVDLGRYKGAPDAYTPQQIVTQHALVEQYTGTVKADQGAVDSAQVNLDYCTIRSPVTGRIGLRLVDQGNIVYAGNTFSASGQSGLAKITQLQPITVQFPVPQRYIPNVIGNSASISPLQVEVRSSQNDLKPLAVGKLVSIDSGVNLTSATVSLKAEFDNKDLALFPGDFVNAKLLLGTLHNVVLVPEEALQLGPDGYFVYVVKTSDMTVDVRPVTVGVRNGDIQCVTNGLSAGETIVTMGVDKLTKGAKVRFEPSSITRESSTVPSAATQPSGHHHRHTDSDASGATAATRASE